MAGIYISIMAFYGAMEGLIDALSFAAGRLPLTFFFRHCYKSSLLHSLFFLPKHLASANTNLFIAFGLQIKKKDV